MEYPICKYCNESSSKEECDYCMDSAKQEVQRQKDFLDFIEGKTCTECGEIITRQDAEENDASCTSSTDHTVNPPVQVKEYYHYRCSWQGKFHEKQRKEYAARMDKE